MYPQIMLSWGGLELSLSSYRLFMGLFALSVSAGAYIVGSRKQLNKKSLLSIILLVNLAALLGSRLLYLFSQGGFSSLTAARVFDLHFRYFSVYGGLTLAGILGFAACLLLRLNPWVVGDAFAPGLGIGLALAKTGCFFNGCCFGKVSTLPWSVSFPPGSQAFSYQIMASGMTLFSRTARLHPVQLYEALAALAGALICVWVLKKYGRRFSGLVILTLGMWFTAWRWGLYGFRASVIRGTLDHQIYPWLYGTIIVVCLILMIIRIKTEKGSSAYP